MDELALAPSTVLVTTQRASSKQRDGRLGHEVKNILSGLLLARAFNFSYVPPSHLASALGFPEVDEVLELERFASVSPPSLRLTSADAKLHPWSAAGKCPPSWRVVVLNETGFSGIESFGAFRDHLAERLLLGGRPGARDVAPPRCLVTSNGFRIHLHHAHAWEMKGYIAAGTYSAVTRTLRGALRPMIRAADDAASWTASAFKSFRSSGARYPTSLLRAFAALSARALLETRLFTGVDVRVFTEPTNSTEVFTAGCPPPSSHGALAASITCRVTTGSLRGDLWALAEADVLGLSSSSFSTLGYYLRASNRAALVPIRSVSQFFSAHDGTDGRNASKFLARAAERARPPSNLLFVHQALSHTASLDEQGAEAALGQLPQASIAALADSLRRILTGEADL